MEFGGFGEEMRVKYPADKNQKKMKANRNRKACIKAPCIPSVKRYKGFVGWGQIHHFAFLSVFQNSSLKALLSLIGLLDSGLARAFRLDSGRFLLRGILSSRRLLFSPKSTM